MQTAAKLKPQVAPKKQAKKQRELKVVRSRRGLVLPDSSALFGLFLLISVMLAIGLIFNVSQRALIAQIALQNKQLEDQLEKEELRQQQLQIAKTELSSPYRIEQIAVGKLGMTNTSDVDYLKVPDRIGSKKTVQKPANAPRSDDNMTWNEVKDIFAHQVNLSSLSGLGMH
jgi:cell division protein FtsL